MNRKIDDTGNDTEGHVADALDAAPDQPAEAAAAAPPAEGDTATSDDDDGSEGHVIYARNVGVNFDID